MHMSFIRIGKKILGMFVGGWMSFPSMRCMLLLDGLEASISNPHFRFKFIWLSFLFTISAPVEWQLRWNCQGEPTMVVFADCGSMSPRDSSLLLPTHKGELKSPKPAELGGLSPHFCPAVAFSSRVYLLQEVNWSNFEMPY